MWNMAFLLLCQMQVDANTLRTFKVRINWLIESYIALHQLLLIFFTVGFLFSVANCLKLRLNHNRISCREPNKKNATKQD